MTERDLIAADVDDGAWLIAGICLCAVSSFLTLALLFALIRWLVRVL